MRALVDQRASERRRNNGAHLNVNELDVQVLIDRVQCAHQRDLRRARDNQRGRVMFEAPHESDAAHRRGDVILELDGDLLADERLEEK